MIYFDNAATGGFKPRAVSDAAETVIRYLSANPGRGSHRLAVAGERTISACRELLAEGFSASPDRVIFTKNCTEALNIAIFGTIKEGGHVVTTCFEHNSVLRPLTHLKNEGKISLDIVFPEKDENIAEAIAKKITDKTCLVAATTVSNVTGKTLPVGLIGALCKKRNIPFLADGAQGAGHLPLSLSKQNISMLAVPAHKGLYGIMGAGALIFKDDQDIKPLLFGGTGNESFNLEQPSCYPERLEAGTLNLPAIAAFKEGASYALKNSDIFAEKLFSATEKIVEAANATPRVKCYSKPNPSGIVALEFENFPSAEASDILNARYDVAVRGGLHCAPLLHEYLGTKEDGLVRVSLAVQNTAGEINYFIKAMREMAKE